MNLKIGTRGSRLALIQTQLCAEALHQRMPDVQVEVVVIQTEGDRNRTDSLTTIGGRGVFVRDIEQKLLNGEIDCCVHSLKDMPATEPDGLTIAAVLERGDARDALVARDGPGLANLPAGARVGSSSRRRTGQILALRADLQLLDIRGNVDTRLRKLDEDQYDAIVLAACGLSRLGMSQRITHYFAPDEMLPAVGQGALAVQCRTKDAQTVDVLARLDDAPTRAATSAERAFLRGLGGGCQLPIATFAEFEGERLSLRALVASADGGRIVRAEIAGKPVEAEALGVRLAAQLLADGVREMMETNDGSVAPGA